MSILVVQVLPSGMIFGADRNITVRTTRHHPTGQQVTVVYGQSQRSKVLRWPNNKALVGYVGTGVVGGLPTDEWLYDFIGDHLHFADFEALASDLSRDVEAQRTADEGSGPAEHLILHLGGFEEKEGHQVPMVWYIRNHYDMDDGNYLDVRKQFLCSEAFCEQSVKVAPAEIRGRLAERANNHDPFWFHQGIDLKTFNTLELFLRKAFALLPSMHSGHSSPQTLDQWARHLKMGILTYGCYVQAFEAPGAQYVGGGADTVSLAWPTEGE